MGFWQSTFPPRCRRSCYDPDRRYERWRWQIFVITWLAYAGFNLTRGSFAIAKVGLGEGGEQTLTQPQMAWIDGGFLLAYAIGQFIWGVAGDKLGPRRVVAVGMFGSVLAAFAMAGATSALMFGVCFFIQGLCQSSGWSPLLKNVGNFFSQRERGFVLGLWCTNYSLGGLMASVYAGYLGHLWGWRYAFVIPAVTLLAIWILFLLLQRNRPEDVGLPAIEAYHHEPATVIVPGDLPEQEPEGSWRVVRQVITNPMILLLGAVYFCLKPARYAILFWGPKYLNDQLGTGMLASGFIGAMYELAGPFSILFAGVISDRWFGFRRMPVTIISLVLLAGLLFFLDDLPRTRWVLGGSLFLLGFLTYAPEAMISGLAPVDFGTKKGASTASGVINGLGSVGAVIGGMLPGLFQSQWGWHGVFATLAALVLLAALLLLPKWNALPPTAGGNGNQLPITR